MEAPEHAVSFHCMGASVLDGMLQEPAELCGESSLLDGAAQPFTCSICSLRVRHSDGPRPSRFSLVRWSMLVRAAILAPASATLHAEALRLGLRNPRDRRPRKTP